jgi:hypothetical protein
MTADERRLLHAFRALPSAQQQSLIDFSEFLIGRANPVKETVSELPLAIPRPERESVVKAIKRLRETYPMIDRAKLLHEISGVMTQHLVHGKSAPQAIDELELLFKQHFDRYQAAQPN